MTATPPRLQRKPIRDALIVAGLLLGGSVLISALSPRYLSHDLAQRLFGIMVGTFVVVNANAVPKALTPLANMRGDPAAEQSMRRFVGWCMTLGGAGYVLSWIFAPIEIADTLAPVILFAAVLLVLTRIARCRLRPVRA
ncbi:MAG: hypothetical protein ABJE47_06845 [bacterium]